MKKEYIYGIGVLFLIAVVIFFRGCDTLNIPAYEQKSQEQENVNDSNETLAQAESALNTAQIVVEEAKIKIDSLQKALNKCLGVPEPLTVEQRLEKAEKELAILKKNRSTLTKKSTTEDVTEKVFSSNDFTSSGSVKKTIDQASDKYAGAKVSFKGKVTDGSIAGITTTADRFRLYYIKDNYLRENGMSIPAPRLNGVDGPEFSFDSASSYWYYLDTGTLMSPTIINNWDYPVIWCVYIGRIGTWDAYLPHESMKGLMKKVRGREDGAVTMDELYRMNQINSEVWTDKNLNGLLMPKSFNPISGERERGTKIGSEDGKEYQGWDFRCRTTGEVTTEEVQNSSSSSSTQINFGNGAKP